MDLREIEWGGVDWINLAQNRGQWTVAVNLQVLQNFGKLLSS
jgi:hypothetical protein